MHNFNENIQYNAMVIEEQHNNIRRYETIDKIFSKIKIEAMKYIS